MIALCKVYQTCYQITPPQPGSSPITGGSVAGKEGR